jgi:hypothetical protein
VAETVGAHLALSSPAAEIWRQVAHGELSPDEGAARVLEGREAADASEREEIERAKLVFAPVTEERREEVLQELLAERRKDEVVVSLSARGATKGSSVGRGWIVGIAVAAAAMLVLWLLPGTLLRREPFAGEYRISVSGMDDVRSTAPEPKPGEVQRFELDETIMVVLRPEEDVVGSIEVVGFARQQGGEPQRLELEPRIESNGFVEIRSTPKALALQKGAWELLFAIGREGELPDSWAEAHEGGEGYAIVRATIEVVSPRER